MRRNIGFFRKLTGIYKSIFAWAEKLLYPFLDLAMRFSMAQIFFTSGCRKCENWGNTIFLFTHEHPVHYISPEIAAGCTASIEVAASCLLFFGLLTRASSLLLLILTGVIQFSYINLEIHYFWGFVLATIMLKGPSLFSIDYWINNWMMKRYDSGRGYSKH